MKSFSAIEKKWQKEWERAGLHKAKGRGKKWYSLIEFPYPSGEGLHVGHIRSNTAMDIISRKRRMEGYDVLYPIGWDAFGLPTENYAIKTGVNPAVATKKNTDNFRRQLKALGFSFDWSREVNTTDPAYYKWTQWMFLQFFKHGLAYKAEVAINWCPKDKIGLANEEAVGGVCDRCGGPVEKRMKEQWMLKITAYADKLLAGLKNVDYIPQAKIQQENWIGRSEGALIKFKVQSAGWRTNIKIIEDEGIEVFTTRPDTLFGATLIAISVEHEIISKIKNQISNTQEVQKYIEEVNAKADLQRTDLVKEKTGMELKGIKAINPANNKEIPVWVVNYVLGNVGTGAIMAVPAHDERDFEFAKKYTLPIRVVIEPETGTPLPNEQHRSSIVAIVEDPVTKKFLTLNWGSKLGGTLFIGGGREEGEDVVQTAMREIGEETGYTNVQFVARTERMHHHYFAFSKNVARNIEVIGLYFKLNGNETTTKKLQADEKGNFKIEWLTREDVLRRMEDENHLLNFRRLVLGEVYTGKGILMDSGQFSGMDSEKAKGEITKFVGGQRKMQYKLRDWVFSRQRYWGEPIPLVFCSSCKERAEKIKNQKSKIKIKEYNKGELSNPGWVAVPDKDLPVKLPKVKKYQPRDDGQSPLASVEKWMKVKCPQCKGPARRETDTMPNWAGSSWYFLRYIDPKNKKVFADSKKLKYFMPVDWYNGGMEHTVLHLLYSRFWNLFLYDLKLVPTAEPYKKRTSHGLILAEGGVKMSKSKGNVINPDSIVKQFGADSLRLYEMFMGPFDQAIIWNTDGLVGMHRFLERVQKAISNFQFPISKKEDPNITRLLHQTIKKVTEDIEGMRFNTALSALMVLFNTIEKANYQLPITSYRTFLKLLAPFAPHITEELWAHLGHTKSIHLEKWPKYDAKMLVIEEFDLIIQVNGKTRDRVRVAQGISQTDAETIARGSEKIKNVVGSVGIKKVIYVPGRLINIVL